MNSSTDEISQTPTGDEEADYRFQGEIDKLRSLLPIIKSCRVGKVMTFIITASGFKLISEDESLSIQSSVYLHKNLFKSYHLPDGPQTIDIRIDTFLALVEMLFPSRSTDSSITTTLNVDTLKLTLDHHRELKMSVANGPQQTGEARMVAEDRLDGVRNYRMQDLNRACFDAFIMVDFWTFADLTSQFVHIKFDKDDEEIVFGTRSPLGEADYKIDFGSAHIETCHCDETMEQAYEMKSMKHTAGIAKKAKKISIGMDQNGTLNMKVFVVLKDGVQVDTTVFPDQTQASLTNNPENNVYVEYFVGATVRD